MADAADKAHAKKEEMTAGGERLVPHATFTDGDRELRAVCDDAEVARVEAFQETGYVAAPGVGDYHAHRRAAKLAAGAGVELEDPSTLVVDQAREGASEARKDAAALRRGAESRSSAPAGRRSVPTARTGAGAADGSSSGDSGVANQTAADKAATGSDKAGASKPARS